MSERPASIAFDDLAVPKFSPAAREMLDGMGALGASIVLDADALIAQARTDTGLDDYGAGDDFFERLRVFVGALGAEAELTDAGKLISHSQVLQLLTNRLLATDFIARHPAVHDEIIAAPIVIVGLPRTGTTHLHNLISADTNLRSLPYWESLEPVPTLAEQTDKQRDARRERCEAGVWFLNEVMPDFKRMHEMTVDHVHEEIQLLAIDCSTMLFESSSRIPSFRDYYQAHDQQSSYDYLRLMLQLCQYQSRGARPSGTAPPRWVLKSPQHLEQIPAIMRTFPDAIVVFTHRDPVSVVASFVTMSAYSARISRSAPIDLHEVGAYWRDRILDLYAAATRDRHLVPAAQSIDIHFNEFMRDDIATVQAVYEVAGLAFAESTRAAMAAFMDDHPRGKYGGVQYDLGQFGLDPAGIRSAAQQYIERFGVALELQWQ